MKPTPLHGDFKNSKAVVQGCFLKPWPTRNTDNNQGALEILDVAGQGLLFLVGMRVLFFTLLDEAGTL